MKFRRNIPNLFTLANLFCGCLAILFIFNDRIEMACYLVFAGAFFDFIDGFVARLLKTHSPLGKQLDSLSDMVTFGVIPSLIMMHLIKTTMVKDFVYTQTLFEDYNELLYLSPAFFIALFSGVRLGRFNVDENQGENFIGLPTPASAIFIASLALAQYTMPAVIADSLFHLRALYAVIIVISYLMVSPFPMFSLKFKGLSWRGNELRYIFLAVAAVIVIIGGFTGLAAAIVLYILLSIIYPFLRPVRS